jgi:DNA invertase Pin-like site-specific DNA recombinase
MFTWPLPPAPHPHGGNAEGARHRLPQSPRADRYLNQRWQLVFHFFGALAEFERVLIREQTQAGLAAARARGHVGGRPKAEAPNAPQKIQMSKALYEDKRKLSG